MRCAKVVSVFAGMCCFSSYGYAVAKQLLDPQHIVEMPGIGSQPQAAGLEGRESDVDIRSPDGRFSATVVRRGDLAQNENGYDLLLYRFADGARHSTKSVIAHLTSRSNEPAISSLTWLGDSNTLVFLGIAPQSGRRQVFCIDVKTRALNLLTSEDRDIESYRIAGDRSWIVVEMDVERSSGTFETNGGVVRPTSFIGDLLAHEWSGWPPRWSEKRISEFTIHGGLASGLTWHSPDCESSELLGMSPDGLYAIHLCHTRPRSAKDVDGLVMDRWGNSYLSLYALDLRNGAFQELRNVPVSDEVPTLEWKGMHAVVVSPVRLPNGTMACQTGSKSSAGMLILLGGLNQPTIECTAAVGDKRTLPASDTSKTERQRPTNGWFVEIEHALNEPSRLVARSASRRDVLIDTGEGIQNLDRVQVKVLRGRLKNGIAWTAGLYEPASAETRPRFPLVIQTHGFNQDYFAPQGVTTSGAAAQSLALNGIAVAQFDDTYAIRPDSRVEELSEALEGYESLVDTLSGEGLIDPTRVGIQGWSITGQHVYYALQHSRIRFAAALVNDAQVGGYFEKVAAQNVQPSYKNEGRALFGATPEGSGLERWMNTSPGFNMDLVRAPVRMEANELVSLPFCWEAYSRLLEFHKPVELYLYPDGAHTLVKPSQRIKSIEGSVDWFRFWLRGISDTAPEKEAQYRRWNALQQMGLQPNATP